METIHLHNKKFNIQFQICSPKGMASGLETGKSGRIEKEKNKKSEPASYLPGFRLEQNQRHFQFWSGCNAFRIPALKVVRAVSTS